MKKEWNCTEKIKILIEPSDENEMEMMKTKVEDDGEDSGATRGPNWKKCKNPTSNTASTNNDYDKNKNSDGTKTVTNTETNSITTNIEGNKGEGSETEAETEAETETEADTNSEDSKNNGNTGIGSNSAGDEYEEYFVGAGVGDANSGEIVNKYENKN